MKRGWRMGETDMNTIVGIDLGTTNSGVAVVRNGAPQMLPNGDERIIPSVVGHSPQGEWLVGTPARNQVVLHPEETVRRQDHVEGGAGDNETGQALLRVPSADPTEQLGDTTDRPGGDVRVDPTLEAQ